MKRFKVVVNGDPFEVEIEEMPINVPAQQPKAAPVALPRVQPSQGKPAFAPPPSRATQASDASEKPAVIVSPGTITAPMPGSVKDIKVNVGDNVKVGDTVLILEAMKMENEILSKFGGVVKEVLVKKGQSVNSGDQLLVIG